MSGRYYNEENRRRSRILARARQVKEPLFQWFFKNKLFATTPLIGFGFIHYSKRIEAVLWYILIGIFTYVTAMDIKRLLNQWNRHDTSTVMTVIYQKTVPLPDMTICLNGLLPDYHLVIGIHYSGV